MTVVPFRRGAKAAKATPPRPVVLIADAGPLAYLAGADALDTLGRVGTRTEMLDMVLGRALRAASPEGQGRLAAWAQSGVQQGSVQVIPTAAEHVPVRAASRLAGNPVLYQDDTTFMVAGWLALRLLDLSGPVLVLHADERWARLAAMPWSGSVCATRLAEFLGLAPEPVGPVGFRRPNTTER